MNFDMFHISGVGDLLFFVGFFLLVLAPIVFMARTKTIFVTPADVLRNYNALETCILISGVIFAVLGIMIF
jgi:hypothetical protein